MVRLYDNQAQLLILLLTYVQDSLELRLSDVVQYFQNQPRRMHGFKKYQHLGAIANELDPPDGGELVECLLQQLTKSANHDADLVELIVGVLGLEYSRNRIASGSVEELRKAILLPDELRKVKESLQKKELQCSCGHVYHDGELTTLSVNREGVFISCARCRLPQYVVCLKKTGCENIASIDPRDLERMSRAGCYSHKKKDGEGKLVEDPMVVQQSVNRPTPVEAFRTFTVGNARQSRGAISWSTPVLPVLSTRPSQEMAFPVGNPEGTEEE